MAVYITEHAGANTYRQPLTQPPLAAYFLSTTTTASATLQAGTKYVRVSADAGSFINNNSTSGTLTLTSTNSFRIPGNAKAELFSVSTAFRIQAAST